MYLSSMSRCYTKYCVIYRWTRKFLLAAASDGFGYINDRMASVRYTNISIQNLVQFYIGYAQQSAFDWTRHWSSEAIPTYYPSTINRKLASLSRTGGRLIYTDSGRSQYKLFRRNNEKKRRNNCLRASFILSSVGEARR